MVKKKPEQPDEPNEVLGVVDYPTQAELDEWELADVLPESELVDAEMFLEFATDNDYDYSDAERLADEALEEFTMEEILIMNEMEQSEAVALLFRQGELGLPAYLEVDEEDETVPGEATEDEDV